MQMTDLNLQAYPCVYEYDYEFSELHALAVPIIESPAKQYDFEQIVTRPNSKQNWVLSGLFVTNLNDSLITLAIPN